MCSFLLVQGPTLLQLLQPSSASSDYNKIHFSSHIFSQPPQDWDCPSIPPKTKAFVIPQSLWDVPAVQLHVEDMNPCQIQTFLLVTALVKAVQAPVRILLYQNIGCPY